MPKFTSMSSLKVLTSKASSSQTSATQSFLKFPLSSLPNTEIKSWNAKLTSCAPNPACWRHPCCRDCSSSYRRVSALIGLRHLHSLVSAQFLQHLWKGMQMLYRLRTWCKCAINSCHLYDDALICSQSFESSIQESGRVLLAESRLGPDRRFGALKNASKNSHMMSTYGM